MLYNKAYNVLSALQIHPGIQIRWMNVGVLQNEKKKSKKMFRFF